MAMNRTNHSVRRDVGLIEKIAAVVLGLAILGYVARTQGEHASPPAKAASAVGVESASAKAGPAEALDAEWLTHLSPALDEERGAIAAPRECELSKGIDTACIFN
jgi:hypothetical protein